jgi:hypothetical protein
LAHFVYHAPTRHKIGATSNLERRLREQNLSLEDIEVLWVSESAGAQRAGDLEHWYARSFGYYRGSHYTGALRAAAHTTTETRRKAAAVTNARLTPEEKSARGRAGARALNDRLTRAQRSENGRKGAQVRWKKT